MAYKDAEKQKEAGRERQRRYRDKQNVTPNVTPGIDGPKWWPEDVVKMSATAAVALLQSWARGEGTDYQQTLGKLAATYDGYAAFRSKLYRECKARQDDIGACDAPHKP